MATSKSNLVHVVLSCNRTHTSKTRRSLISTWTVSDVPILAATAVKAVTWNPAIKSHHEKEESVLNLNKLYTTENGSKGYRRLHRLTSTCCHLVYTPMNNLWILHWCGGGGGEMEPCDIHSKITPTKLPLLVSQWHGKRLYPLNHGLIHGLPTFLH